MPATEKPLTVSTTTAADILDVTPQAVRQRISDGRMRADKNGEGWQIPLRHVLRQAEASELSERVQYELDNGWIEAYRKALAELLGPALQAGRLYERFQAGEYDEVDDAMAVLEDVDRRVSEILKAADKVRGIRDARPIVDQAIRKARESMKPEEVSRDEGQPDLPLDA